MSKGFYWVESWVPELGAWVPSEAFYSVGVALTIAENARNTRERDYRVVQLEDDDDPAGPYIEVERFIQPGYWSQHEPRD